MTVGKYCNRNVVIIDKNDTIQEAVNLMRKRHVGDVIAVDKPGVFPKPMGILTDRDIVLEILAEGVDMNTVRVSDVMSYDLVTVREELPLHDALQLMRDKAVRRLPVVNTNGGLIGILTADDALRVISDQLHSIVSLVANQNKRERARRQ